MIREAPCTTAITPHRTGATLVEVLMALLIMAIGVTSVFTLFPLAILRAVKANQMTNSKLYEGSIKDLLLGNTQLWTGAPEWSEQTAYCWPDSGTFLSSQPPFPSRWVTPKTNGRLLPDTNVLFVAPYNPGPSPLYSSVVEPGLRQAGEDMRRWVPNQNDPTTNPNFGGYQNNWPVPLFPPFAPAMYTKNDGSIVWTAYKHSPDIARPEWSAYVVDPLGWYKALTPADQRQFGQIVSGDAASSNLVMDRIHCQLSSDAANQFFRLQDSWNETVETTPVTVSVPAAGRLDIVFPDTMDVTGQTSLNRVVLRSTLSPQAIEIPITGAAYPTTYTLQIDGVLPAGYVADQARIEVQSPSRYSWLMAIHAGPRGEFEAQCAVVFNRTFETLDEQGYRAEFCQTEDLNNDGDVADTGEDTLWPNGRNDTNMAKVRWLYNADSESPRIKEGGYIFDASHGYWYQIQKIEVNEERVDASDVPDAGGTHARSILKLSDPVNVSTGNGSNANAFSDYLLNDDTNDCQAVIIPGVIHVFSFAP